MDVYFHILLFYKKESFYVFYFSEGLLRKDCLPATNGLAMLAELSVLADHEVVRW